MAKRYADRRCPDCGWLFTPTGSQAIRCLPCRKERSRAVHREYERLHRKPPMPPKERLCLCGQAFTTSHPVNAKRCPACRGYRYADVPHIWFHDLVHQSDDPEWRRMSAEEWHQLNDEMDSTMRRGQAEIDAEKELAGQAHIDKRERLARILGGLGTNV